MKRKKQTGLLNRLLFTLLPLLMLGMLSMAQDARKITGTVIQKGGEPLSGTTVTIKGTAKTVQSDVNGTFAIYVKTGETIVVSHIGFAPKTFKVLNTTSQVNFEMEEEYIKGEDVIVVGYGKMKKTDLSSSQVAVTSADIAKTVNTSFDQALQGRAANVYVSSNSGEPGAAPSVI